MNGSDRSVRVLSVVYAVCAVGFLALFVPFHPYPLSFALKAVPVLSLVAMVILRLRGTTRLLLILGLLFSVTGDIVLDVDRSRFFIVGLGSFLVAHVFYTVLFLRRSPPVQRSVFPATVAVVYGVVVAVLLRNMDSSRIIPVMIYLGVIVLMTVAATFYATGAGFRAAYIALAGAWVFMFSDTVIAINQFLSPISYSLMYSLPLYWIAQALIVAGVMRSQAT